MGDLTYAVLVFKIFVSFMSSHVGTMSLPNIPASEKDVSHWHKLAHNDMLRRLKLPENTRIAKNVVLFIGDGLGGTTITASRILKGQLHGAPGEESVLEFEKFPHVALSKTYNVDRQTPDSAATATAILSGTKTNYYTIGMDPRAEKGDCEGSKDKHVTSILDWVQSVGKSTGIVTTARLTHATPAAAYAHSVDRYWESDAGMENVTCKDIAAQLIDENMDINVLFGGGRRNFMPNTSRDPEYPDKYGYRQDGRDLIREWQKNMEDRGRRYQYVHSNDSFNDLSAEDTDFALGVFEPSHMQYELERSSDGSGEPSLAQMTDKAIRILRKNTHGFFALVEGARIDHGHHDNLAKKALHDTLAFEEAIRVAVNILDLDETLVIVTADHSHAFDIAGYAYRGADILDLSSAFEEAIHVAVNMLDLDETLVIVTADHSHAFDIAGYAYRGADILEAIRVAVNMLDLDETLVIVTADHSHAFDIAGYAYRGADILEAIRVAVNMLDLDETLVIVTADHSHAFDIAGYAYRGADILEAIRVAVNILDLDKTLVIVTADHSHAFDIAGYAYRGADILSLVDPVDPIEAPTDSLPYSVLIYGNGPAYSEPRKNLSSEDMHDNNFAYPSAVPMPWETHGGEDVMIYATGPMAHLFHGVHEQSYIAHVMAYSMCVGPYVNDCRWTPRTETNTGFRISSSLQYFAIVIVYVMVII